MDTPPRKKKIFKQNNIFLTVQSKHQAKKKQNIVKIILFISKTNKKYLTSVNSFAILVSACIV